MTPIKPPVYDLFDMNGLDVNGPAVAERRIAKFPHRSSKSRLTLVRFTAPNVKHPTGTIVAAGYPPFAPEKIGMKLVARA